MPTYGGDRFGAGADEEKEMSMAESVELIQRFYDEVIGQGNVDVIGDLVTEDVVDHEQTPEAHGVEGVRQLAEMMASAFSDIRATIGPSLESGDLVSAHVTLTGR